MENLPVYISIVFILTLILTGWFFYKATNHSKVFIIITILWLIVQTAIALSGFYTDTKGIPPHFILSTLPPVIIIILLFFTKKGKLFLDSLDIKMLTLLHIIRIPIELVLLWLFIYKTVPAIMTFEGRNFDILSGITAPFIFYFVFVKKIMNKKILLFWNVICLLLLINITITAILSAPFAFQRFGFSQPDIAILYFPFIWLPSCVVPLVLLSHLAAIKQLLQKTII